MVAPDLAYLKVLKSWNKQWNAEKYIYSES